MSISHNSQNLELGIKCHLSINFILFLLLFVWNFIWYAVYLPICSYYKFSEPYPCLAFRYDLDISLILLMVSSFFSQFGFLKRKIYISPVFHLLFIFSVCLYFFLQYYIDNYLRTYILIGMTYYPNNDSNLTIFQSIRDLSLYAILSTGIISILLNIAYHFNSSNNK